MENELLISFPIAEALSGVRRVFVFGLNPIPAFEAVYALALRHSSEDDSTRTKRLRSDSATDAAAASGGTRGQTFHFSNHNSGPPRGGAF